MNDSKTEASAQPLAAALINLPHAAGNMIEVIASGEIGEGRFVSALSALHTQATGEYPPLSDRKLVGAHKKLMSLDLGTTAHDLINQIIGFLRGFHREIIALWDLFESEDIAANGSAERVAGMMGYNYFKRYDTMGRDTSHLIEFFSSHGK